MTNSELILEYITNPFIENRVNALTISDNSLYSYSTIISTYNQQRDKFIVYDFDSTITTNKHIRLLIKTLMSTKRSFQFDRG
jgi:hypothetical protein